MIAISSIRGVAFATLFVFGSGCTIIQGAPYQSQGTTHSRVTPRPAASKPKPRPTAKPPSKPKPAQQHPSRPQPKPKPQPTPKPKPKPKPQPKPDPKPQDPGATQIVVPVRVDFADAVARIDAMIQKTQSQDWQTVSGSGAATRVEVRYQVWRDPIEASFEGGTLKVRVGVRYAADVRASVKNPFGGRIWITKGVAWGSKSAPQELAARFHARFNVEDDFRVTADAKLVDIDHGKAPGGEICVKAAVKLCVTREALAPMVHKKLEAALVPRIEQALDSADKQFEKAMNLKKQAQQLWTALQQPQPLQQIGQANCPSELGAVCSKPAWLVARPTALGVAQPRMDGKDLRVDLAIGGQLTVQLGDAPAVTPAALPKLQPVTGKPGFAVHAKIRVPTDGLADELTQQLKGKHFGSLPVIITRVSLSDSADRRHPNRIHATISLGGAVRTDIKVHGDLTWDAQKRQLALDGVDYTLTTDDPALKQLSAANKAALLRLIEDRARWKLDSKTGAMSKAITRALNGVWRGHLHVNGQLDKLAVEHFAVEKDIIALDILLAGQLDIALSP